MTGKGRKKLELAPAAPLRDAIVGSLAGTLEYARAKLATRHDDPTGAVHEYRKSLRRTRSLIRLLRPVLSKSTRRRIGVPLKEAHRATSRARDTDVLISICQDMGTETAAGLAAALADSRPPVDTWPAALNNLPNALADQLAGTIIEQDTLIEGVRRLYRDARRELARVHKVADPVHVHALRKRTKDVVYALELMSSRDLELDSVRQKFANLAKALGEVTDAYLILEALDEHGASLGDGVVTWRDNLKRHIKIKRKLGIREADRLYRRPSKKFAKRLR